MSSLRVCLWAAFIISCSGCASSECESDQECDGGLECLPLAEWGEDLSSCQEVGMSCSMVCIDDEDCASLGDDYLCFAGCDEVSVCGRTAG